jgi:hypothetical protein
MSTALTNSRSFGERSKALASRAKLAALVTAIDGQFSLWHLDQDYRPGDIPEGSKPVGLLALTARGVESEMVLTFGPEDRANTERILLAARSEFLVSLAALRLSGAVN